MLRSPWNLLAQVSRLLGFPSILLEIFVPTYSPGAFSLPRCRSFSTDIGQLPSRSFKHSAAQSKLCLNLITTFFLISDSALININTYLFTYEYKYSCSLCLSKAPIV